MVESGHEPGYRLRLCGGGLRTHCARHLAALMTQVLLEQLSGSFRRPAARPATGGSHRLRRVVTAAYAF